jgi:hypothetical protein
MRSTSRAVTASPMPIPMAAENGERTPCETARPPPTTRAGAPEPRAARVRSSCMACARSMRRASATSSLARPSTGPAARPSTRLSTGGCYYGRMPSSESTRVAPETWLATQST